VALTTRAQARANGIAASSCTGCHGGGPAGSLTLTSTATALNPGERAEFTLSVVGGYAVAGVYINTGDVGALQIIADQGLRAVTGGLVHERPKPASGSAVQFRFSWVAPTTPGAVRFYAYAVGGDGNNRSTGDAPMDQSFDFVYGCTAKTFYLDGDGDGVGRMDFTKLGCADTPPEMFVAQAGDCDDFNEKTYPSAPEICNLVDDNCDGQVDENVPPVELWPDADSDGYYDARTEKMGEPKMGCAGLKGWAALSGDCQPNDPAVNPGVVEVCNDVDDDCDGDVDERVRPTCGEGWCRRESLSCDAQYCKPGDPVAEKCNYIDDDCDGEIDEDPNMCPAGQICQGGGCVVSGSGGAGTSASGQAGTTSAPASGSPGGGANDGNVSAGSVGQSQSSAGCALGAPSRHGALAALALAAWAGALRRRRVR
jgi:putative metal-binding protein